MVGGSRVLPGQAPPEGLGHPLPNSSPPGPRAASRSPSRLEVVPPSLRPPSSAHGCPPIPPRLPSRDHPGDTAGDGGGTPRRRSRWRPEEGWGRGGWRVPPVSAEEMDPKCWGGREKGRVGTTHSLTPAPPVPQPLCWGGGPGRPRSHLGRVVGGRCGVGPPPFSPRLGGAVWARGGAGGRAERGGRGRGRPATGPRRGQHDRALPLLPALGTARTGGVPGGHRGERDSSAGGPRSGVSERGWSRERAMDGSWWRGGTGRSGGFCIGTGVLGAGGAGGVGPAPALGEQRHSGDRQGRLDTGAGLAGTGPDRERGREEPRGSGGVERDPARESCVAGQRDGGCRKGGLGWDAGQGLRGGNVCVPMEGVWG